MRRNEAIRNYIIYMLLIVFLIVGSGMGLDGRYQVFVSGTDNQGEVLEPLSFYSNIDLHTFQTEKKVTVTADAKGLRNNSDNQILRGLFFFCILAILLGLFQLNQKKFILHSSRYIKKKRYIIRFMQDIDGRKRFP